MIKVFSIGFNRCGTQSLHKLFTKNGYMSAHWGTSFEEYTNTLSRYANGEMENPNSSKFWIEWNQFFVDNHNRGYDLCKDADEIIFWSDIQFLQRNFQLFAHQYPESKFILNTRNIDNWIRSRWSFYNGEWWRHDVIKDYFSNFNMDLKDESDIKKFWKFEWIYHKKLVEDFFMRCPDRLLVFDIEKDNIEKIINFLPELDFTNTDFPHIDKTEYLN